MKSEKLSIIFNFLNISSLDSTHPCSATGRHHETVLGAADVGVVAHAEVVSDLVRHHVHRGEPRAGVRLAAGVHDLQPEIK